MSNKNLETAKKNKDDEFYTLLEDVEKELSFDKYWEQLENKHILFPCDRDFETLSKDEKEEFLSNGFIKGINDNFAFSRYFNKQKDKHNLKLHFSNYDIKNNKGTHFKEAIENFSNIYAGGGIVITNPPFSKIREFVDVLLENNVKFLIIAPKLVINYNKVFEGIKDKKTFIGYTLPDKFIRPGGGTKNAPCLWITNLNIDFEHKKLDLNKKYNEKEYANINYNTINVDKTKDIPIDYYDNIAVPITFLVKNDYKLFDIVEKVRPKILNKDGTTRELFVRIIIKRKKE